MSLSLEGPFMSLGGLDGDSDILPSASRIFFTIDFFFSKQWSGSCSQGTGYSIVVEVDAGWAHAQSFIGYTGVVQCIRRPIVSSLGLR